MDTCGVFEKPLVQRRDKGCLEEVVSNQYLEEQAGWLDR